MGQSPSTSKFDSDGVFSSTTHGDSGRQDALLRRISALPAIRTHNLGDSGSRSGAQAVPHRRTRSANVASTRSLLDQPLPPPPYSAVAGALPSIPPRPNPRHGRPPSHPSTRPASNANSQLTLPTAETRSTSPNNSSRFQAAPVSTTRSNTYLRTPIRQESRENALETLRKYNTVFIVDDSRSMYGQLWREAKNALATLAEHAQKYDTDGIDVHFLNDRRTGSKLRSAIAVKRLFDSVVPKGITPMGEKLEELLLTYLSALEHAKDLADSGDATAMKTIKPVNYIVITDGTPTDDPESVIVSAARRLDEKHFPITQVGIQFVQIGDSPQATEFLMELDDGLASNYGVRDMVDTTAYTGGELTAEILTKILLGGINRRVDRRGGASVLS